MDQLHRPTAINAYLHNLGTYLFNLGYKDDEFESTISMIATDIEDRYFEQIDDDSLTVDQIEQEFGTYTTILSEYNINAKPRSKIRAGSRYTLFAGNLLLPVLFLLAYLFNFSSTTNYRTGFPYFPSITQLEVFRSNQIYLMAAAIFIILYLGIYRYQILLPQYDPRRRWLNNTTPWIYGIPAIYPLVAVLIFLPMSSDYLAHYPSSNTIILLNIVLSILFAAGILIISSPNLAGLKNDQIHTKLIALFWIVIYPQILWMPIFDEVDRFEIHVITSRSQSGNVYSASGFVISPYLIISLFLLALPIVAGVYVLIKSHRSDHPSQITRNWLLGNGAIISLLLHDQFGMTFIADMVIDNFGGTMLGYGRFGFPWFVYLVILLLWNSAIAIIMKPGEGNSKSSLLKVHPIIKDISLKKLRVLVLLVLLLLPILALPQEYHRSQFTFTVNTDGTTENGYLYQHTSSSVTLADIPSSGSVRLLLVVPVQSELNATLQLVNDGTSEYVNLSEFTMTSTDESIGYWYTTQVESAVEIGLNFNLTVYSSSSPHISQGIQVFSEFDPRFDLGWYGLWIIVVMLSMTIVDIRLGKGTTRR